MRRFAFLLVETIALPSVGLIFSNVSELLVKGITELSYRECTLKVNEMTGQSISAMGGLERDTGVGRKGLRGGASACGGPQEGGHTGRKGSSGFIRGSGPVRAFGEGRCSRIVKGKRVS